MQLWAVMIVRNEVDILALNVLHHLSMGVDRFLIVDNGSTDGTRAVLGLLARDGPIRWTIDSGPARQSQLLTELAREAYLGGADWVLPIDADEFWWGDTGNLRSELQGSLAGALRVEVINFVQRRSQNGFAADALLHMNRRPPSQVGPVEVAPDLVEQNQIAFVEMMYPPKWVSRATVALEIEEGNHGASGIDGPRSAAAAIVCLHAPLRSRAALQAKGEFIASLDGLHQDRWWHVVRWRRLAGAGLLDREWAANSYADDRLDVYGSSHPLVRDARLVDLIAPWVGKASALVDLAVSSTPSSVAIGGRAQETVTRQPITGRELRVDAPLFSTILARIRGIDGQLRDDEARLLMAAAWRVATNRPSASIVEVGSYCGQSTVALASVLKASGGAGRVHVIEPHNGGVGDRALGAGAGAPMLETLRRHVAEADVADVVEVIPRCPFAVTRTPPADLLFLDEQHGEEGVRRDFAHFESFVSVRGCIVFHNAYDSFPRVNACVEEALASGRYREVARAGSLVVLQKLSPEESLPAGSPAVRTFRLEQGIGFLRRLIHERDGRLEEQQRAIAWLQEVVSLRDAQIAEHETGIAWLRGALADREATVAERDKAIEWLRTTLEAREATIADHEKAICRLAAGPSPR